MPEISRFYGIVIRLFYGDHMPPHFHVSYGSCSAKFNIENLNWIEGNLPPRATAMVEEWLLGQIEDQIPEDSSLLHGKLKRRAR